ncbi:hypothetical protein Drorol1_Dr00002112 [Drosera rotundifolia]
MASLFCFMFPLLSLAPVSLCSLIPDQPPQHHIVYMGASSGSKNVDIKTLESGHLDLLSTIIPREERERVAVGHVYHHAFRGFSAMLTDREAFLLSGQEDMVSVFPDPILKLHTTRSWDFLDAQVTCGTTGNEKWNENGPQSRIPFHYPPDADVIIGMIDTGIWPESPSFSDKDIGEVPKRWKGVCMEGPDFTRSNCNRKLIGARYYDLQHSFSNEENISTTKPSGSPRDHDSHGTHTTAIAAGSSVANASYAGLAQGTARGGLPSARIAIYKACSLETCHGSIILKAIDDAIKDGVDILSLSLGMNFLLQSDFLKDPIAIGAFHANQMGIMVVSSAGNDGPDPYTVVNTAPWIFTIAASSIDRDFESTVLLGNGFSVKGSAINFSNLTRSSRYRLAFAGEVAADFTPPSEASSCYPGSLNPKKVAGKIVVCVDNYASMSIRIKKLVVEDAGARGIICISHAEKGEPFDSGAFPCAKVGDNAGIQILNYINSTKKPTATILPTVTVPRLRPAPVVADFSSRGPGDLTENILKPDIMAPGVAILAATIPENDEHDPTRKRQPKFGIKSGTSMACPHVTGAAAYIKSRHHHWTPSMIKSALMTTATTVDNTGRAFTNSSGYFGNPHETGVGEINPIKALDPGLVFPTMTYDYLRFLCYCGYSEKNIQLLSSTEIFTCPKVSSNSLITNINYPSISIAKLKRNHAVKVTRYAINVGPADATYEATLQTPQGLRVHVSPKKLIFQKGLTGATFNVSFHGKGAAKGYNFGSITWFDGLHTVKIVFAINIV